MRFKTEFELDGNLDTNLLSHLVPDKKHIRELGIGQEIGMSFGWGLRELKLPGKHTKTYSLEIEAFPMDKWIEFKKRFADALPDYDTVSRTRLINALAALEEFHGKPSGDAITNLPDRIEYRGPASHCKACEDEKKGIKHIMAQKHTCQKQLTNK